ERRLPDLVTTAWWKEERGEKIFVDFNQACRDRTIASAYSPRPLQGAPVSMPVRWAELDEIAMADFTVHTVPGLLDSDGDAWAGIGASRGDLSPALRMWQEDLDRGLGEMPFPPEYPKMPGEPPRVQPSKRRTGADQLGRSGAVGQLPPVSRSRSAPAGSSGPARAWRTGAPARRSQDPAWLWRGRHRSCHRCWRARR